MKASLRKELEELGEVLRQNFPKETLAVVAGPLIVRLLDEEVARSTEGVFITAEQRDDIVT